MKQIAKKGRRLAVSLHSWFVSHPRALLCLKAAVIFTLFVIICFRRLDPDFGWHLRAGDYIRQHGIPGQDIFTFSARSFEWINHEVGHDILLSFLYSIGGYGFVGIFFTLLWTAVIFITSKKHYLYLMVLTVFAIFPYVGVRPAVWTLLGLALLLRHGPKAPSGRVMIILPLAMVLWANFHGGFIIGLGTIAFYTLKAKSKRWAFAFLLAFAATLINPYGYKVYEEILRTLLDGSLHHQVSEWARARIFMSTWPLLGLWGGLFFYFHKKWHEFFDLSLIFLVGALSASRNVPLFALSALSETEGLAEKIRDLSWRSPEKKARELTWGFMAVLMIWAASAAYSDTMPWTHREAFYPRGVAAHLNQNGCKSGNLLNFYDYGGYLIWKAPNTPVYIDGRMPSWQDDTGTKYLTTYYKLMDDVELRKTEFEKQNITCVILPNGFVKFKEELEKDGWREEIKDEVSFLMVKN